MFFQESEALAHENRDLARLIEQIDRRLSGIYSSAPLRPDDFSSVLGAEENQVVSVFELLAQGGVLRNEKVVECERCHNLMSAAAFLQAADDEDDFECTGCGRVFRADAEPFPVYRMSDHMVRRTKEEAQLQDAKQRDISVTPSSDEPLGDRGQLVLIAMLELGAIDSDSRKSTEEIAAKALGSGSDANALKGVMAELKTRQFVQSKTGRGGGCWLSDRGIARGEKLRHS